MKWKEVAIDPKFNLECFLNAQDKKIEKLKKENKKLKNFINNLILTFNHCELNGTKKLDIVSDYIKQEYEKVLKGEN